MDIQSRPGEFVGQADSPPEPAKEPEPVKEEPIVVEEPAAELPALPESVPVAMAPVPEPAPKYWGRGAYFSIARAKNPELRRFWIGKIVALGLDRVVLEDVGDYFRNPRRVMDFITELKAANPDVSIGVAGDNVSFFRAVAAIPVLFSQVDSFHYGFEFWNPAHYNYLTRADSFVRALSDLSAIREIVKVCGIDVEMVLGWFSAEEAGLLAPLLDRVFFGSWIADTSSVQTHIAERFLEAPVNSLLDARVLLSADSRYASQDMQAVGLQAFEERYREYARDKPQLSGVLWSSLELLPDSPGTK